MSVPLKAAFVAATIFPMLAVLGPAASAHYVYQDPHTWAQDEQCVQNRSEISHGNGGGYRKGTVKSERKLQLPWVSPMCETSKSQPPGYMIVRPILVKVVDGSLAICNDPGWITNTVNTHLLEGFSNFGTYPPCGDGYYGTLNGAAVFFNGKWLPPEDGVLVFSGQHWLRPSTEPSANPPCQPAPPPSYLQCDI